MAGRIWVDVTHARLQPTSVGIGRTVRSLANALTRQSAPTGLVVCAAGKFRALPADAVWAQDRGSQPAPPGAAGLAWANGALRRLGNALVPLPWLQRGWSFYTRRLLNNAGAALPAVDFRAGDLLILADQSWNYDTLPAIAAARARGARVALVVYDLIPLRHPQYCHPLFTRVFGPWLAGLLPAVDQVACISRATLDDLQAYCAESGIQSAPATHFRLGCDLAGEPSAAPVRAELGDWLSAQTPCFVTVGSLEPRKNHGFLLDAFEALWADGASARLIVAGRPHPESVGLLRRIQEHPQLGRRLLYLPDANDAEIAVLYNGCRALICPTLAEGFGLPLVEARYLGCPVLASRLEVFTELADEGVRFFEPGDTAGLCALILEAAQASARPILPAMQAFTWVDSARQLLDRLDAPVH